MGNRVQVPDWNAIRNRPTVPDQTLVQDWISAVLSELFAAADLSGLPTSDPGDGNPWLHGSGSVVVGAFTGIGAATLVPYSGATGSVNLGSHSLTASALCTANCKVFDNATFATFAHNATANSTGYAIQQFSNGTTYLNAASGRTIQFRNNNVDIGFVSSTGISVLNGLYFYANNNAGGAGSRFGMDGSNNLNVQNISTSGNVVVGTSSASNTTGSLLLQTSGVTRQTIDATGAVVFSGLLRAGTFTVGTLPSASANAGKFAEVSDSSIAAIGNYGATVIAGGSNRVPVRSNGTNWVIG